MIGLTTLFASPSAVLFIACVWGGALIALLWYSNGQRTTPDGTMYLQAGRGDTSPLPYSLRWLLPWLLKTNLWLWQYLTIASLLCSGLLLITISSLVASINVVGAVVLMTLWLMLPMNRLNLQYIPLVDAPATMIAIIAATSAACGHLYLAIFLSLLSGTCKETAPVLAYLVAALPLGWTAASPLLLGVIAPAIRYLVSKPGPIPQNFPWLINPLASARQQHRGYLLDPRALLLPWGALLILMPHSLGLHLGVALLFSYGQMIMANDLTRLYQWSAPVVILLVAPWIFSVSATGAFLLCLIHIFNPWGRIEI